MITQWIKAFRIHQWVKNTLIFLPLLAAHEMTNVRVVLDAITAFVFFSILTSGVYVLNDINDRFEDSKHPLKRNRPFASGSLSPIYGYILATVFILGSISLCYYILGADIAVVMIIYFCITTAYTYAMRKYWIIDVIILALLYTIRIIVGGVATQIELTFWILAFSMFIFFSLAMVKRYVELSEMAENGEVDSIYGRGYLKSDMPIIASMGSGSGYLAVAVLALYINDLGASHLYSNSQYIWAACPVLLYWITRIWMLAHRGMIKHDPLLFAIRDMGSMVVGVILFSIFWMAT